MATGVSLVRKPATTTPSRSTSRRTYSPPRSSPMGATRAVSRPSRAAATAVIAPPPGERMSSPAKRSSPGAGSASRPTKVRSRKAGVVTASSMLSKVGEGSRCASAALGGERPAAVRIEEAQSVAHEPVAHRVAHLGRGAAFDLQHDAVEAEERLAPERLDVLDRPLERPDEPVVPQASELGPDADGRVLRCEPEAPRRREAHP